jgi:hypothetical protein
MKLFRFLICAVLNAVALALLGYVHTPFIVAFAAVLLGGIGAIVIWSGA